MLWHTLQNTQNCNYWQPAMLAGEDEMSTYAFLARVVNYGAVGAIYIMWHF